MKRHVRGFKYQLRFVFVFVFVFVSTLLSLRPILCNSYRVFSFCSILQWVHFPISETLHGSPPPVVLGIVPQPDPHRINSLRLASAQAIKIHANGERLLRRCMAAMLQRKRWRRSKSNGTGGLVNVMGNGLANLLCFDLQQLSPAFSLHTVTSSLHNSGSIIS